MKKILSIVLVMALCLGLFAACDAKPTEPATSNLANAKQLLSLNYKPSSKDEIPVKSSDFELMSSVLVEGVSYPVEWTVSVTAGPADSVKLDGNKVDLTEKPTEEVKFTLTATIKDDKGNTETVSFNFMTPAFEAPTADKVVIKNVAENKYATGIEYKYTSSSSGKVKMELPLTENKAEAIAFTLITNDDGTVSFKTDCGKYLYCDGNSVEFADAMGDYTKYVLDVAEGGYYVKCAVANYNGNPQYLEIYSGYLTCYGLNDSSNHDLYIFALEDAAGAAGKVEKYTEGSAPETTESTEAPETGKAYKFGMVQGNVGKTFYLAGGMDGYYMATTTDMNAAIDVYLEATEGGYYFYTMINGTKTYINMVVSGTHVNGAYEAAASTVYTFDAESKTLIAVVDGIDYWFATRNDKTYTTMGPCKTEYKGFFGQFYG